MKKLLFLGACLVTLASQPVKAQTGVPEVIVMRTEYVASALCRISISRGEGKTEIIDVKDKGNALVEASQKVIAQLYQQGYSLKGSLMTSPTNGASLVFVKGQ
ncbi:MAG: hypothetical protein ACRYFZ_26885 [Janthinobacterium lividum]